MVELNEKQLMEIDGGSGAQEAADSFFNMERQSPKKKKKKKSARRSYTFGITSRGVGRRP